MNSDASSSGEAALVEGGADRGLYVHVPFCARACPYCDFDFDVAPRPDAAAFVEALDAEWSARGLPERYEATTVYVGGGTPSVLAGQGLAALLRFVSQRIEPGAVLEWTVELNPEHVDEALLQSMRPFVTRASLGVQGLSAQGLRQLGRMHDARQALAAIASCRDAGLDVSADLIVGWPGQTERELVEDIEGIVAAGAEHVSIYALTIEAGTPWEKMVSQGRRRLPVQGEQADALALAERRLTALGLAHYEVASYARPGKQSRHNRLHWTGHDYVGLGPSAASASHGSTGSVTRRTNVRGFSTWRRSPGQAAELETLTPDAAAAEALWVGLRLFEGVHVPSFVARFEGVDLSWLQRRVAVQVQRGNLVWDTDRTRLRVASERWLWHDEICAALL